MNELNHDTASLRQMLYPLLQALWTEKLSIPSQTAKEEIQPEEKEK